MTPLQLSHFSPEHNLRHVYSQAQEPTYGWDNRSCFDKPRGLWVSVDGDDDWLQWCTRQEFRISPHRHRVHLAFNANILHLATLKHLTAFRDRWSVENHRHVLNRPYIAWEKVAECYQGIIIAPYQWGVRFEAEWDWYNTWDCASGCIWDASAIASVEPIHALEAA